MWLKLAWSARDILTARADKRTIIETIKTVNSVLRPTSSRLSNTLLKLNGIIEDMRDPPNIWQKTWRWFTKLFDSVKEHLMQGWGALDKILTKAAYTTAGALLALSGASSVNEHDSNPHFYENKEGKFSLTDSKLGDYGKGAVGGALIGAQFGGPWGALIGGTLGAGFVALTDFMDWGLPKATEVISKAVRWITEKFGYLWDFLKKTVGVVKDVSSWIFNLPIIKSIIGTVLPSVVTPVQSAYSNEVTTTSSAPTTTISTTNTTSVIMKSQNNTQINTGSTVKNIASTASLGTGINKVEGTSGTVSPSSSTSVTNLAGPNINTGSTNITTNSSASTNLRISKLTNPLTVETKTLTMTSPRLELPESEKIVAPDAIPVEETPTQKIKPQQFSMNTGSIGTNDGPVVLQNGLILVSHPGVF